MSDDNMDHQTWDHAEAANQSAPCNARENDRTRSGVWEWTADVYSQMRHFSPWTHSDKRLFCKQNVMLKLILIKDYTVEHFIQYRRHYAASNNKMH